jgi:hypothetical protein
MGDEVEPCNGAEPLEAILDPRNIEPWSEKTWGLGALSGRYDYKHLHSLP